MRRGLLLLFVVCLSCGETPRDWMVTGTVLYRSLASPQPLPDEAARVWIFSDRQPIAEKALAALKDFERRFPRGIQKIEQRFQELEAMKAAMVLMSYSSLHKKHLLAETEIDQGGHFEVKLRSTGPLSVLIESAKSQGAYHQKRYASFLLQPENFKPDLSVDFGVSHLEQHEEEVLSK